MYLSRMINDSPTLYVRACVFAYIARSHTQTHQNKTSATSLKCHLALITSSTKRLRVVQLVEPIPMLLAGWHRGIIISHGSPPTATRSALTTTPPPPSKTYVSRTRTGGTGGLAGRCARLLCVRVCLGMRRTMQPSTVQFCGDYG